MNLTATAALLLALALAGCGGDEPAATGAPIAPVATPTSAAPTPTVLSKEDAGRRYLALVELNNKAVQELAEYGEAVGGMPNDETLPRGKEIAARLADANRTWGQGLLSTQWPADVQPTARDLAANLASRQGPLRQMADAPTVADYLRALGAYNEASKAGQGLSELMRQQLGLAERPVS